VRGKHWAWPRAGPRCFLTPAGWRLLGKFDELSLARYSVVDGRIISGSDYGACFLLCPLLTPGPGAGPHIREYFTAFSGLGEWWGRRLICEHSSRGWGYESLRA